MKYNFKTQLIMFAIFVVISLVLLLVTTRVQAAGVDKVLFKDHFDMGDTRMSLRGTGLYKYLGLIKAYAGALYVEDGKPTEDVLADTAKRLELEYFHPIKSEDLGKSTSKLMARNTDVKTLIKLQPRIEKYNTFYRDVKPGDRCSLTYIPGRGTELAKNGKAIGIIEGADFASVIYAMWLGQKPINRSFKRQLLGYP